MKKKHVWSHGDNYFKLRGEHNQIQLKLCKNIMDGCYAQQFQNCDQITITVLVTIFVFS